MFGNIVSVKVAQNKNTGESLCYGFVHFSTDEDAQKAIDKVNGMSINGSIVKVEAFKPRGDKDRVKSETFNNIYAKNFPESFTQQQLEEVHVDVFFMVVGEGTPVHSFVQERVCMCVNMMKKSNQNLRTPSEIF
jgi:RNA recognition motif-containing protein